MPWQHLSGDFILTVTRSGNSSKHKIHVKRKEISPTKSVVIYSLSSFDDVIAFCKYTKNAFSQKKVYLEKNTALYKYQDIYYICFRNINGSINEIKRFCSSISEFGNYIDNSDLFERKLVEYGTKIIDKNVIGTINKKFK